MRIKYWLLVLTLLVLTACGRKGSLVLTETLDQQSQAQLKKENPADAELALKENNNTASPVDNNLKEQN